RRRRDGRAARSPLRERPPAHHDAPVGVGHMEHPFFFEANGYRLFALAHRPKGPAARVGIVARHPYGGEKERRYPVMVRCARALARDGFPVLRFDARGHGDSEGEIQDATVETYVREVLAAGRIARETLGVERIVFLGLRLGASVAARAAERDPSIAGLV